MNQTSTLQKRSGWRLLGMSTENDDLIVQVSPDIYKKLSVGIGRKKTKAETNMDKNLDKACERLSSQTPLSSFISRKV